MSYFRHQITTLPPPQPCPSGGPSPGILPSSARPSPNIPGPETQINQTDAHACTHVNVREHTHSDMHREGQMCAETHLSMCVSRLTDMPCSACPQIERSTDVQRQPHIIIATKALLYTEQGRPSSPGHRYRYIQATHAHRCVSCTPTETHVHTPGNLSSGRAHTRSYTPQAARPSPPDPIPSLPLPSHLPGPIPSIKLPKQVSQQPGRGKVSVHLSPHPHPTQP